MAGAGIVIRNRNAQHPSGGGGGGGAGILPVLSSSDVLGTRLGAYRCPGPDPGISTADWRYAYGLTVRYESSDTTQPIHLMSATYHPEVPGPVNGGWVYEFRDRTPETPANPQSLTNYSSAPFPIKEYGNIYGTVNDLSTYKRLRFSGSELVQFANGAGVDPRTGMYWDAQSERLYWSYAETYSGQAGLEEQSYHFGYSTLNYSTGESTARGPWRLDTAKFKSGFGGFVRIPSAFVTTAGLGSKAMGIGFGGYGSLVSAGDVSLGPALTAFAPPSVSTAEQTALSSLPLIGYWPTVGTPAAGRDRATRPSDYDNILQSGIAPYDTWPGNKWQWNDGNYSFGVWIHGANKGALVIFTSLQDVISTYTEASFGFERQIDIMQIISEQDLHDVATGARQKHEIQATAIPMTWPSMDFTQVPWGGATYANISTITSVAGQPISTFNATVTCASAHGLTGSELVSIRGTSNDTLYRGVWAVQVINATTFKIKNASFAAYTWSGTTVTGGAVRSSGGGSPRQFRGAAFDENTNKLYLMYYHYPQEDLMMEVFSVNC
jgi:hypothetical protein